MPILSLVFLTGILLCLQLSTLTNNYTLFFLLVLGLFLLVWRRLRYIGVLLLGFAWCGLYSSTILSQHLVPELIKQDVVLEGRIAGLVAWQGSSARFDFIPNKLSYQGKSYPLPGRIRLSWYYHAPSLETGQHWRLQVRLKPPHGLENPGGTDYERWLFQHHIRATGYVREASLNHLLTTSSADVDGLRQDLRQTLQQQLHSGSAQAIFPALLLGDRSAMDKADWQVLNATGTSHLLAISGLHIGIVAMLGFVLISWAIRYWPWALTHLSNRQWGALAAILCALAYVALSGFALPAQRALVMLSVLMLGVLLRRQTHMLQLLALALILVLIYDPVSPLAAGFWLSFGAVALLAYGFGGQLRVPGSLLGWTRAQYVLFIGMMPLLFAWFAQVSLWAPFVNLLAIPWITLVLWLAVAGLLLLPLPGLGSALLWLAEQLFTLGWSGLTQLAHWGAPWSLTLAAWQILALMIAVLILLMPRGLVGRGLGAFMALLALSGHAVLLPEGGYRLTVLDVGQGLASVVQTRHHTLVFDTGPRYGGRFNSGERVLLPFLRSSGIQEVDRLVVSHGDNDHIGGASALISGITVDSIISSVPQHLPKAHACVVGQHWEWDGVRFSVLHPSIHASGLYDNNRSCVVLVVGLGGRVLLTGDIEAPAEAVLLERQGQQLSADVLVAPHHGSLTSSTKAFIQAVSPRYVVYATGYRNRYHFPRPEIIARYRDLGSIGLNTAYLGAIDFLILPTTGLQYGSYRQQHHHFWSFGAQQSLLQ